MVSSGRDCMSCAEYDAGGAYLQRIDAAAQQAAASALQARLRRTRLFFIVLHILDLRLCDQLMVPYETSAGHGGCLIAPRCRLCRCGSEQAVHCLFVINTCRCAAVSPAVDSALAL